MSDIIKDYYESIDFWNNVLKSDNIYKLEETWIKDNKFNEIISKYINSNSNILDYGCGSGWAIFEIYQKVCFKYGIGIDTSFNAINNNKKIIEYNNINNIEFINSNESVLTNYQNYFDFVISINLFDVIPDEIIESILCKLYDSLKLNSYIFIGLNPVFSIEELKNLIKMEQRGNYFYKDNILRCNKKSIDEWITLFNNKFTCVEQFTFKLTENEEKYPRIGFLLKK